MDWQAPLTPLNAGTHTLTVVNPAYGGFAAVITPITVVIMMRRVPLPATTMTLDFRAGLTLGDVVLPLGWAWLNPAFNLNSGIFNMQAWFEGDDNHETLAAQVRIYVNRLTPDVRTPYFSAIDFRPNISLWGTFALSDGWTWFAADRVLAAGTQYFEARFVPADTLNFYTLTHQVRITINRAAQTGVTRPTSLSVAGTFVANQTLANFEILPEGWNWRTGHATPVVAGARIHVAYFAHPTDPANFADYEVNITFSIAQATPLFTVPIIEDRDFQTGMLLSQIALPAGWEWVQPYTVVPVGNNTRAARFTPADTDNYHVVIRDIALRVTPGVVTVPDQNTFLPTEFIQGMRLSDINLPSGWRWRDPHAFIGDGYNEFEIVFDGNSHYGSSVHMVRFNAHIVQPAWRSWLWLIILGSVLLALLLVAAILMAILIPRAVRRRRRNVRPRVQNLPPPVVYNQNYMLPGQAQYMQQPGLAGGAPTQLQVLPAKPMGAAPSTAPQLASPQAAAAATQNQLQLAAPASAVNSKPGQVNSAGTITSTNSNVECYYDPVARQYKFRKTDTTTTNQ